MKRIGKMKGISMLLAAALILCLSFGTVPAMAKTIHVTVGTASVGGMNYPLGIAMATLWNSNIKDVKAVAIATGGSVNNIDMLRTQDIEVAVCRAVEANRAFNGIEKYKEKMPWIRSLTGGVMFDAKQVAALKSSGIKTIADFKGKKIDFGSVGQGIEVNTRELMSVYGLKDEDVTIERFGRSEVAESLKVGDSQAHIWTTNAPNAQVTDMVRSGKVGLIGISPENIEKITKDFPHYAPAVIPGGVYEGFPNDIPVVAAVGSLLTYEDMPDEVIYKITKMLYENKDFLRERLNYFNDFKLENALAGMAVPLHPGAKKYYIEAGLLKE